MNARRASGSTHISSKLANRCALVWQPLDPATPLKAITDLLRTPGQVLPAIPQDQPVSRQTPPSQKMAQLTDGWFVESARPAFIAAQMLRLQS